MTLINTLLTYLNDPFVHSIVLALIASGALRVGGSQLADIAAKLPFGFILAPLVRALAGNTEKWLSEHVPAMAVTAVLATEEEARADAKSGLVEPDSFLKLYAATQKLKKLAPGLTNNEAQTHVNAALVRARPLFAKGE